MEKSNIREERIQYDQSCDQFAALNQVKAQSVRARLSRMGDYFGETPLNRRHQHGGGDATADERTHGLGERNRRLRGAGASRGQREHQGNCHGTRCDGGDSREWRDCRHRALLM